MNYTSILVETRGKVGLITLNRPQALNALNTQLMREVMDALEAFDKDDDIGAMVITGSDKAFAAGKALVPRRCYGSQGDTEGSKLSGLWGQVGVL